MNRLGRSIFTHSALALLVACGTYAAPQIADACGWGDDSDIFEEEHVNGGLNAQATPARPIIGKTQLIQAVADKTSLNLNQSSEAIAGLFEIVSTSLKSGTDVELAGLGTLRLKVRPARVYKNPSTGADVPKPPTTYVAWTTKATLKAGLPAPSTITP